MEPRRALDVAFSALRVRDLSTLELEERLAAKGYDERERQQAVAELRRLGLLDDRRFAEGRAVSLAARGAGDLLIRDVLARVGVDADIVEEACAVLEPEAERARLVVAKRGASAKTARYLSAKGFATATVAGIVANDASDEIG